MYLVKAFFKKLLQGTFDQSKQQSKSKCICKFDGGWIFDWNPKTCYDRYWTLIACKHIVIAFKLINAK